MREEKSGGGCWAYKAVSPPLGAIPQRRGRQYIGAMLSALKIRASGLSPWRWLSSLPSQCVLCNAWQAESICQACVSDWRHIRPRCPRCAIDLRAGLCDVVCSLCEDQSPEFARAVTAVDFVAPWSPLISKLKFNGATHLAKPLGQLLAKSAAPRLGSVNLLIPVPLSRQRLIERGYNQSWLLAQQASQYLGLEARHDLLQRVRHTSRLMTLSAQERGQHIKDAFSVTAIGARTIEGRDVALVDDVMTTGATLNEVASTLTEAGARSVSVWVLARTPMAGGQP